MINFIEKKSSGNLDQIELSQLLEKKHILIAKKIQLGLILGIIGFAKILQLK